jgi:DNA-directed RNA polymerase subunit RPC12/RpoP
LPALEEPRTALRERAHASGAGRLFDPGGERTLDDVLLGLIEDASEGRAVRCPVCDEPTSRSAGEAVLECSACGSRVE